MGQRQCDDILQSGTREFSWDGGQSNLVPALGDNSNLVGATVTWWGNSNLVVATVTWWGQQQLGGGNSNLVEGNTRFQHLPYSLTLIYNECTKYLEYDIIQILQRK